jgi:hypothetical protein
MELSTHAVIRDLDNIAGSDGEPGRQDIGATNAQTDWQDMLSFARAFAFSVLGSWNSSDDLDECKVQSADDSSGSNIAEVTTDASGGNYDTDAPIDADGDFVVMEVRAEDIDVGNTNPQRFLRLYVAEAGNTGTDNIAAVCIPYEYQYPQKELQGAASAGSQVYVTPNS